MNTDWHGRGCGPRVGARQSVSWPSSAAGRAIPVLPGIAACSRARRPRQMGLVVRADQALAIEAYPNGNGGTASAQLGGAGAAKQALEDRLGPKLAVELTAPLGTYSIGSQDARGHLGTYVRPDRGVVSGPLGVVASDEAVPPHPS